nr:MAG TPA: hypothetical protein [Caudoviricetes sp.]
MADIQGKGNEILLSNTNKQCSIKEANIRHHAKTTVCVSHSPKL